MVPEVGQRRAQIGSWVGHALLPALLAWLGACTNLPVIEAGECGNGVIEGRENCDTFAPNPGGVCRPKGSVGECHLDCRRVSGGSAGLCPAGWGCDSDGLCREATGKFEEDTKLPFAGVESLFAGDFDGDGRSDLVSREPTNAARQGKPTVHYFDDSGSLTASLTFPKRVAVPYIADISGDGRADFVFTTFLIGVLLGRADRTWVPETFSSYRLPNTQVRMASVVDRGVVSGDDGIAALTTLAGKIGIFVPTPTGALRRAAALERPIEELASNPTTGDIVEGSASPCKEIVLAYRGAEDLWLYDVCDSDPAFPIWKDELVAQRVDLDPPAPIESGPLIADVNADGHLDVLVAAAGQVYAAYGDGSELSTAVPFVVRDANSPARGYNIPMPLAVGDFSGDRVPDFVFTNELVASAPVNGQDAFQYAAVHINQGAPWSEAVIADFNGNGRPDVLAASSSGLNLSFFNGTGSVFMSGASLSTFGPVEHLALGDYNGDLLNDVAFIEHAASLEDSDSLSIAYGAAFGPPLPPVTVAHVEAAEQVMSFADAGLSSLLVASSTERDGKKAAELAALEGSPDGFPLALHALVSLAEDGTVATAPSFAITVGAFTGPAQHDLLSLSGTPDGQGYEYWLIPSINDSGSAPLKLSGAIYDDLSVLSTDENGVSRLAVAGSSADIDHDGIDEAIWAMPVRGEQCGILWLNVDRESRALLRRGTLVLNEPCDQPALLTHDVDADGNVDILLQTKNLTGDRAAVWVVWNDGSGGLNPSVDRISGYAQAPQAFALLPRAGTHQAFRVAFVTERSLELTVGHGREFEPSTPVRSLERGTGVAAADFNGDGVLDLAVADAGKVRLLKGQLVAP